MGAESDRFAQFRTIDTQLNPVFDVVDIFRSVQNIDRNSNGYITRSEINNAVRDGSVTGGSAASLASIRQLRTWIRGLNNDGNHENWGISGQDLTKLGDLTQLRAIGMIANDAPMFNTIDNDDSGSLSREELGNIIQGLPQGASRRALERLVRDFNNIAGGADGITRQQMTDYVRTNLSRENDQRIGDLAVVARQSRQRIERADRRLFGADGIPRIEGINQGAAGDCYLLSAAGDVALQSPEAIRNMIRPNKDGTYTVNFPTNPRLSATVNAPTDAEIAIFTTGNSNGIWAAVLEKALGKIARETPELLERFTGVAVPQSGAPRQDDFLGAISPTPRRDRLDQELLHGGRRAAGIGIMTGASADQVPVGDLSDEQLHQLLRRCGTTPMTASASGGWPRTADQVPAEPGNGISGNTGAGGIDQRNERDPEPEVDDDEDEDEPLGSHEFSIVGYNAETRMVTIRNPWGHGEFTDAQGIARDGLDDGVMTMSLAEFRLHFQRLGARTSLLRP